MKKIILFFTLTIFLFAGNEDLRNIDYWKNKLSDKDLKFGYYESKTKIVTVNKDKNDLKAFLYDGGTLSQEFSQSVITGKNGDKKVQGDLKTPVGVYDITSRFTPPSAYYGPVAFELSYPNLMDKVSKKTGYGIWIHGFPMDGKRDNDFRTRGCVAIDNDMLLKFGEIIGVSGVVLIDEKNDTISNMEDIAKIFTTIFKWKKAWRQNDINEYLKFYANDFIRFDGMKFKKFSKLKKRIFAKNEKKSIKFSNFSITPYPNVNDLKIYRVIFHEDYSSPSHKFKGNKELYVRFDDGEVKIIIER